ncbi:MAG: hypothetical protein ICV54_21380 [Nostoc sp. C3-bin3]|nr:hypothetical protein [Nostoc sp. C3-bin3]
MIDGKAILWTKTAKNEPQDVWSIIANPKNTAELSNANGEIFGTEKESNSLLALSKAVIKVSIY